MPTIFTNPTKVAFYTLGCKLNFSETSTIARTFKQADYQQVSFDEKADIYVINTCSVTDNADKKFKTIVRNALKTNANSFVIAIGCYAQLQPEEIASIEGVDLVLGASEKFKILAYLNDLSKNDMGHVHACEIVEADTYISSYSLDDRTRAFLKVQDGCDYKCTYCTIPMARGVSRSDTVENILTQAKIIINNGIKEIVLTGVNIGDYGKGESGNKTHAHTFLDLIQALDQLEGINRYRISSIEPNLLNDAVLDFCANARHFVPHFHIPLQSGSNEILKKMKRRYLRELYIDRVHKIKFLCPDACIGVDVIVGFPGETDALFLETYQFLSSLDISYLHIFTYSERLHTEAAAMENIVSLPVRRRRSKLLRGLSVKKRRAFYESQLDKQKSVLWEAENKDGFMFGFTENYVKVKTRFNPALVNTITPVKLQRIADTGEVEIAFESTFCEA